MRIATGAQNPEISRLLGTWECDHEGTPVTLKFLTEDQLEFASETSHYSLVGGAIEVDYNQFPYHFKDGELMITIDGAELTFRQSPPQIKSDIASPSGKDAGYLHTGPILIRNVTVIDGLGHDPYPMRDILIKNGRIEKTSVTGHIGSLPEDIYVIDAKGLTAMPGLIDLHVHVEGGKQFLNANLYSGVTTVLDLGNNHKRIVALRDAINRDEQIGPTIFCVGNFISRLHSINRVEDLPSKKAKAEIKSLLDVREADGIETIKLYGGVSNWSARHIMMAAKKRNMQGIADFWYTNLSRTTFEVTLIDGYAHGGGRVITEEEAIWMQRNDKFAILTLSVFDSMGGHRHYEDIKTRGFLQNPLIVDPFGKQRVSDYYTAFTRSRKSFEDGYARQYFGDLKHLLPDNMKNAKILHDAGVLVGMGTDAVFPPGVWPGEAMHNELELHVRAGIRPLDAIKMATFNGARILRCEHEFGSLEKGKAADIMIVQGDPSTDISDTRNVEYVIKHVKLLDRKSLVVE